MNLWLLGMSFGLVIGTWIHDVVLPELARRLVHEQS